MAVYQQGEPTEVRAVQNILNAFLRWKNVNGPPRSHKVHHPSSWGGCLRKVQYQRYSETGNIEVDPESLEARTIRIFDTGHSMHDRWTKYWEDLGILRGVWQCTNPWCNTKTNGKLERTSYGTLPKDYESLPPRKYGEDEKLGIFKPNECICGHTEFMYHEVTVEDKELNFYGHVDQILDFSNFEGTKRFKQGNPLKRVLFKDEDIPKKPILVDMKSINSFGYKSKLESGAPFGYRVQVNIYLHLLGLDLGILYFENKDDCSTKLISVQKNEAMWEKIKEQAATMDNMVEGLKLPPPRPVNKKSYDCNYCQFKPICHSSGIWNDPDLSAKKLRFYGDFS